MDSPVPDQTFDPDSGSDCVNLLPNFSDPDSAFSFGIPQNDIDNPDLFDNGGNLISPLFETVNGVFISGDSICFLFAGPLGVANVTVHAIDPVTGFAEDTFLVTVAQINGPPDALDDSDVVLEGGSVVVDVLLNDTDPEEDPLTVIGVTQGANGTVTNNGTDVTYQHDGSETLTDQFDYTITDGEFQDTATVSIDVTPVNDTPVALDDNATVGTGRSVSIDVLANDSDVDGPSLDIGDFTQPANGTVVLGSLVYTSALGVCPRNNVLSDMRH